MTIPQIFPGQRFAPFNRRAQPKHRDVNDQDDDGGASDIADAAEFIKQSFRQATGEPEPGEDKTAKAEAALAALASRPADDPERVKASAALIIAAGRATGVL